MDKLLLNKAIQKIDLNLSGLQIAKFEKYFNELKSWKKSNLTGITNEKDIILKHFVDSLTCSLLLSPSPGKKMIDVGTGAGFPGIPLKIFEPSIDLTLLDSTRKNHIFLEHLLNALEIKDVHLAYGRAETFARISEYRENFDLAVSRAVAEINVLLELCLPFVRPGGYFLAMKGKNYSKELDCAGNALRILDAEITGIKNFVLPFAEEQRTLILVRKKGTTDNKYPRKPGIPQKRPLL